MKVDYLIVGAGFTGSVLAERIASVLDKKVLVVEKRNHIGGHAYEYYDEFGVLVHKYGPHIFHTNSKKVWQYLSHFTKWRPYFHITLAVVEGNYIPIPFNLNTLLANSALLRQLHMSFPRNINPEKQNHIIRYLVKKIG